MPVASRDHQMFDATHQKILINDIKKPDVIAYTAGPGLIGALMVGSAIANGLALAWNCSNTNSSHGGAFNGTNVGGGELVLFLHCLYLVDILCS